MKYWQVLKDEIYKVRNIGYENTEIVDISEEYFRMADQTVFAAEDYSQSIAMGLRYLEFLSTADISILIIIMIARYVENARIRRKNSQLEQQAYTDQHTGLPNKGKCEEFFYDADVMNKPVACIVFDLNGLKEANDTLGHSVGDQLIANFARLLRNAVPPSDFVGRYGGDEFMAVVRNASKEDAEAIVERLRKDVDEFNRLHHGGGQFVDVSYACGWAVSTDYPNCSFRILFDKADRNMYEDKIAGRHRAD